MSTSNKVIFREDGSILIKDVRLSYEHCHKSWQKHEDKAAGKTPKYSGKFLLDKATRQDDYTKLKAAIDKMCITELKGKLGSANIYLRDGDDGGKESHEGCYTISASELTKPKLITGQKGSDGKFVEVTEAMDMIYSGAFVNVLIRPWIQNNSHGKKCNANLLSVQFVRHGEKFSQRAPVNAEETFDEEPLEDADGHDPAFD